MNTSDLLATLRNGGVRVALEEGELKLRGSAQVLTPKVLAVAKSHKPVLCELLLLEAQAAPVAVPSAPVEVEREAEPLQVLEPASTCGEVLRPDLRAPLGLEDGPVFFAAVRRVRKQMGALASSAEVHELAQALALLDLGRDPETGRPIEVQPQAEPRADFDAGQAWREHNPQVLEEAA